LTARFGNRAAGALVARLHGNANAALDIGRSGPPGLVLRIADSQAFHQQNRSSVQMSRPFGRIRWPFAQAFGALSLIASAALVPATSVAQSRREVNAAVSNLPTGTSAAVWAGNTLYVSGSLDPDIPSHHDTESQTVGVLRFLQQLVVSQGLTMGDVAMVRVYLGADPAKGGAMDFAGMMAGYVQFFGTKEQPNKPARTTVQVVLPAGARGALVEIDLVAVRP
jgi:enamine deaminase RidA (YjgF/YER057c/UK114 family)